MSSHLHVYLGAYVECTYKPKTRTAHVTGCTNSKCKKHPKSPGADARGKFCEECASPIGKIAITVHDHPDDAEITKEALCSMNAGTDERLWMIPNVHRPGEPRKGRREDGEEHVDMRNLDIAGEMRWFEKAFEKELAALRKHYATVEVKWGIHQFYL